MKKQSDISHGLSTAEYRKHYDFLDLCFQEALTDAENVFSTMERFLRNQPDLLGFLAKHGSRFHESEPCLLLTARLLCVIWDWYSWKKVKLPILDRTSLEKLFVKNEKFIPGELDAALREGDPYMAMVDTGQLSFLWECMVRFVYPSYPAAVNGKQPDSTSEIEADQNHILALVCTVIDAIDESAAPTKTKGGRRRKA